MIYQILTAISSSLLLGVLVYILTNRKNLSIDILNIHKNSYKSKLDFILIFLNKIFEYINTLFTLIGKNHLLVDYKDEIKIYIEILGNNKTKITPNSFIGIQILSGILIVGIVSFILNSFNIIMISILFICGFNIPIFLIKQKAKSKQETILNEIPDVFDLLSMMIEAGIDFSTALKRLVQTEDGILINELRIVQKEILLGISRYDALINLAKRLHMEKITSIINSLNHSLKTGGSLATNIKSISEQLKIEKIQLLDKKAHELPLRLMVPLVLLIFPTIFIVLFGPIVLMFLENGF